MVSLRVHATLAYKFRGCGMFWQCQLDGKSWTGKKDAMLDDGWNETSSETSLSVCIEKIDRMKATQDVS